MEDFGSSESGKRSSGVGNDPLAIPDHHSFSDRRGTYNQHRRPPAGHVAAARIDLLPLNAPSFGFRSLGRWIRGKSRFTEEQIIKVLREHVAGCRVRRDDAGSGESFRIYQVLQPFREGDSLIGLVGGWDTPDWARPRSPSS